MMGFKVKPYEPPHEKTICICDNKGTDQLCSYSAFVLHTRIVQFLYFLNPKFPVCACKTEFVLDLYRNHIVGFLTRQLIFYTEQDCHHVRDSLTDLLGL